MHASALRHRWNVLLIPRSWSFTKPSIEPGNSRWGLGMAGVFSKVVGLLSRAGGLAPFLEPARQYFTLLLPLMTGLSIHYA